MVAEAVKSVSTVWKDLLEFIPPGLFIGLAAIGLGEGKYVGAYRHEFIGTLLMIVCTFSAGKWIGADSMYVAWGAHSVGVIAADFFGGGPHVNPAVTMSMLALGKCDFTEAYVRTSAQMVGGLVAFPLFHAISDYLKWEPFGGPEFDMAELEAEAFMAEFLSTILLCFAIYILNWELNFGSFHYIIKQSLTAVVIRALIEFFPTAGPAMNPMLATAWAVFGVGDDFDFPSETEHYFVYWLAPFLGAILASIAYVIYAGGTIFGATLPIGPLKGKAPKQKKN